MLRIQYVLGVYIIYPSFCGVNTIDARLTFMKSSECFGYHEYEYSVSNESRKVCGESEMIKPFRLFSNFPRLHNVWGIYECVVRKLKRGVVLGKVKN